MQNLTSNDRKVLRDIIESYALNSEGLAYSKEELRELYKKLMDKNNVYELSHNITKDEIEKVNKIIEEMETLFENYVTEIGVTDVYHLEEVKKELSMNLMYLSQLKDKFVTELDYVEDIFKKELLSRIASDIMTEEGISYTQAEKKVYADDTYVSLRDELKNLKVDVSTFKTKYDFFNKAIQSIIQSISIAGKEHYISKNNE